MGDWFWCFRGESDPVCPRANVIASKSATLIASSLRRSQSAMMWGWEEGGPRVRKLGYSWHFLSEGRVSHRSRGEGRACSKKLVTGGGVRRRCVRWELPGGIQFKSKSFRWRRFSTIRRVSQVGCFSRFGVWVLGRGEQGVATIVCLGLGYGRRNSGDRAAAVF